MKRRTILAAVPSAWAAGQVLPGRPDEPGAGRWVRTWWFERGMEHGNPISDGRFRINAPDVVLHPVFGLRSEAKSSGMLQILVDESLRSIDGAELFVELWGGHPGTIQKRVTPNGRTTYWFPEVGTAAGNCTHQYPVVELHVSDLVSGYNAFQFACDKGSTFWGHAIVESAAVRVRLPASHPDLKKGQLDSESASVEVKPVAGKEALALSLKASPALMARVAGVDYWGFYEGYRENGSIAAKDWHGFLKRRKPVANLGSTQTAPFSCEWDTSMIPAQKGVAVRAVVRLKDEARLSYETAAVGGIEIGASRAAQVKLFRVIEKQVPFWSRANNKKTATIHLGVDPASIERAELHTVTWDGGKGGVNDYFKLNGQHFEVAADGKHVVVYTVLPVQPKLLRKGLNEIELLSDTEHHGIEVLEPGPALMVRYR